MIIAVVLLGVLLFSLFYKYEPSIDILEEQDGIVYYFWYTKRKRDGAISRKYKRIKF